MCYKRTCVNTFNANNVVLNKIILNRTICELTTVLLFKVSADQSFDVDIIRFYFIILHPVVTNVHIVHDNDLSIIAWISKHFLVAGHTRIKTYFSRSGSDLSESVSLVECSIG